MSENVTRITVSCSIYNPEFWVTNFPTNDGVECSWVGPSLNQPQDQPLGNLIELVDSPNGHTFRYRAKPAAFSQYSQSLLFTCQDSDDQLVCTVYFNYDSQESEYLNPNFHSERIEVLKNNKLGSSNEAFRLTPPNIGSLTWRLDSYSPEYLLPLESPPDAPGTFSFAVTASALRDSPELSIRFRAEGSQNGVYEYVVDFVSGTDLMLKAALKAKDEQEPWPFTDNDATASPEERSAYNYIKSKLGYDPKDAILLLSRDLGTVSSVIRGILPLRDIELDDWNRVVNRTVQMLDAAASIRNMFSTSKQFISEVYLGNLNSVNRCAALLQAKPESTLEMRLNNFFSGALSIVSAAPWGGAFATTVVETILSTLVTQYLIVDPPPDTLTTKVEELHNAYQAFFNLVLENSDAQQSAILKSWKAIQIGNAMINSGILGWPVTEMQNLRKLATLNFELKIWQGLLPTKYCIYLDAEGSAVNDQWADKIQPPYGDGEHFWLGSNAKINYPNYRQIHTKICRHLFLKETDELGAGLGIDFRDLVEKKHGWTISTVRSYIRQAPEIVEEW